MTKKLEITNIEKSDSHRDSSEGRDGIHRAATERESVF